MRLRPRLADTKESSSIGHFLLASASALSDTVDMAHNTAAQKLAIIIEAMTAAEQQPITISKTRDGWAGYQAGRRVTRYFFSEEGAQEAAADYWSECGTFRNVRVE